MHAYDSSPVLTQNLAQARKLIKEAGADGKTITIGTSSQLSNIAAVTGAYQQAAQAIGLKTMLNSVSAAELHQLLHRPQGPRGRRRVPDRELRRLRRPGGPAGTLVLPGGRRTTTTSTTRKMTALLEQARSTADPDKRAALVAQGRGTGRQAAAVDPERAADQHR